MPHSLSLPVSDESLERLLPADLPARPRAIAVLDGVLGGLAWTDDPGAPRWVLVVEDADGTVFGGGRLSREAVAATLADIRTRSGDLIFGFAGPRDPMRDWVPTEPYWRGEAVDFTERVPSADEAADPPLPDEARLVAIDAALLPRTAWYEDTVHAFGSVDRWLELGIGYALLVDGEVVAEALAGPRCRGLYEMGVVTREGHRRRGYGTIVSRAVARACEARGERVWWNANARNAPSIAIARRLGFSRERRYELVACRSPLPELVAC